MMLVLGRSGMEGKVWFIVILFFCLPASVFANTDHLILVNLTTNQLSFFEDGNYTRTFPITTGKEDPDA